MQAKDLIKYIESPHMLPEQSVKDLQKLVLDFPYFQSAHILLSLASKKWDTSVYQQSLRKTAIVSANRAHLFNLIHAPEPSETKIDDISQPQPLPVETHPELDPTHELEILKAAEISVEEPVHMPEPVKVEDDEIGLKEIEKEIGRQVVTAFVEKEILRTHEAETPAVKEQPASFHDWLYYLKKNNGQPYQHIEERSEPPVRKEDPEHAEPPVKPEESAARKQKNKALIDKIIEKNPGLIRTREEQKFFTPEARAKESLLNNEHLVTETLARIYALQGNISKAVRAYEILSLKFPQKSAYFATLIQKLKNNP